MELTGKRIVVTGGAGFLGSHLVQQLERRAPASLIVPRSAEYDLVREHGAAALFDAARPQVVFHLAARVGGIGANQRNPGRYFYENAAMGMHVIEQARIHGVEKVVLVGTVCAYPKYTPVPFREDSLWDGYPEETNAPYGVAKKALLVMAEAYRAQYGLRTVAALPANLYGPRDNFDLETSHVIPAMICKFLDAIDARMDEVELWGDGSPTREFLYVEDCAAALVAMAERYDHSDPVNLGTGKEVRIDALARSIAQACGYSGRIAWQSERPNGQPRRALDVSRAREKFGFEAKTSLEQGLATTIAWYREHRKGKP